MTALWFGMLRDGVPADENTVRSTATPVDKSAPPAVMPDRPEMGEVETDSNPNLGMVNRQLASNWIQGQQYTPQWLAAATDQTHFTKVNEQIATSGTAAAREADGQFGHGTMSVAIGIEPVKDLTEGGRFGNDYFITHPKPVQRDVSRSVSSPIYDTDVKSAVMGYGKNAAREASEASMYAAFYANVSGK